MKFEEAVKEILNETTTLSAVMARTRKKINLKDLDDPTNRWKKIKSEDFVYLLMKDDKFAPYVIWDEFKSENWKRLMVFLPEYWKKVPWDEIEPRDGAYILKEQPQLAKHIDLTKFPHHAWDLLIEYQPKFKKEYKKIHGKEFIPQ